MFVPLLIRRFNSSLTWLPRKVYRDELSVLRTLADVVGSPSTVSSPPYIIDSPLCLPVSNKDFVTFGLAKQSGRESARYIINTMPDVIAHFAKEIPRIVELAPLMSKEKVLEDALASDSAEIQLRNLNILIDLHKPAEAWQLYSAMERVNIDQSVRLRLLDLLCGTNGGDCTVAPPCEGELFFNRNHFAKCGIYNLPDDSRFWLFTRMQGSLKLDYFTNTRWSLSNSAEQLYASFPVDEVPVAAQYSILRGAAKFGDSKRAFDMANLLESQGHALSLVGYKALLASLVHSQESHDKKWSEAKRLLAQMEEAAVTAATSSSTLLSDIVIDTEVFELLFRLLRFMDIARPERENLTVKLWKEMEFAGVSPNLAILDHLLNILVDENADGGQLDVLNFTIEKIKQCQFSHTMPLNAFDFEFFTTAMFVCKSWKKSNLYKRLFYLSNRSSLRRFVKQDFYSLYVDCACYRFSDPEFIRNIFDIVPMLTKWKKFLARFVCINMINSHNLKGIPILLDSLIASRAYDCFDECFKAILQILDEKKPKSTFVTQISHCMDRFQQLHNYQVTISEKDFTQVDVSLVLDIVRQCCDSTKLLYWIDWAQNNQLLTSELTMDLLEKLPPNTTQLRLLIYFYQNVSSDIVSLRGVGRQFLIKLINSWLVSYGLAEAEEIALQAFLEICQPKT